LDIELYEFDKRWFDADYACALSEDGSAAVDNLRRAFFSIQKDRIKDTSLFLRPMLSHVYRWRSLKLPYISGAEIRFMPKCRAPQLEVFHFDCSKIWDTIYGLGPGLFGGYAPRLRDVRLGGVYVPLSGPNFVGLKTLCLRNMDYSSFPVQRFLFSLRVCPLLEEFALQDVQFFLPDDGGTRADDRLTVAAARIGFPFLRYLLLENLGKWPTHAILTSIVVPPSLHLCVDMQDMIDLHDVFPRDMTNLPNLALLRSLWIESEDGWCFLYGSSTPKVTHNDSETRLLTVGLGGLNTHHIPVMEPLLRDLNHILPMPQLEVLYININEYPFDVTVFAAALQGFPNLHTLTLSSCSPSMLKALFDCDALHPCPLLDTLELHFCAVSSGLLKSILESRRMVTGADRRSEVLPLRSLVFLECPGITSTVVSDLERLGVEVRIELSTPFQTSDHLKKRLRFEVPSD